jgi:hypothetical protein
MSKPGSNESPKKLMSELDELAEFLSDGPELQGELKLPQDGLFAPSDLSDHPDVPVLTVKVGESEDGESDTNLDALVDDLVKLVMPRLEAELRRRLKKKISDLPD